MTHELKIRIDHFQAIIDDLKTFEIRSEFENRHFNVGDFIRYEELDMQFNTTGRTALVLITHMTSDNTLFGMDKDVRILSIKVIEYTS